MKRANDKSLDSGRKFPVKRSKASQACAACRRQKTRCEILDNVATMGSLQCHRCKTLRVECSFQASNIIHISSANTPGSDETDASSARHSVIVARSQHSTTPSNQTVSPMAPVAPTPPDTPVISSIYPEIGASSTGDMSNFQQLRPEDLLPAAGRPLGIARQPDCGFDWSSAPLLALRDLADRTHPRKDTDPEENAFGPGEDHQLTSILSKEQISRLLEIFEIRYHPWLYIGPCFDEIDKSPLMQLVSCAIASRHLDPMTRSKVAPRLHRLVEETFLSKIFNPVPSIDSISALVLLSLWSSESEGSVGGTQDGRLLAASAICMAMNLRMGDASAQLIRSGTQGSTCNKRDLSIASTTWMLLSVNESILCFGTGRTPLSRRSKADLERLNTSSLATLSGARDARVGYTAKLLEVAEAGLSIRLESSSAFDTFYIEIEKVMVELDCLYNAIFPLPVVSRHEKFFFNILLMQFYSWKALILHQALRQLRDGMGPNKEDNDSICWTSWLNVRYHGISVAQTWGNKSIQSAQAVLALIVAEQDLVLFGAAPDYIFTLITFAATWLIISSFSMYQLNGTGLGSPCERLVAMTIEKLSQMSYSPQHTPAKCAHIIASLLAAWEQRIPRAATSQNMTEWLSPKLEPSVESTASGGFEPVPEVPPIDVAVDSFPAAIVDGMDFNFGGTTDPDFWNIFLDNLRSESMPPFDAGG